MSLLKYTAINIFPFLSFNLFSKKLQHSIYLLFIDYIDSSYVSVVYDFFKIIIYKNHLITYHRGFALVDLHQVVQLYHRIVKTRRSFIAVNQQSFLVAVKMDNKKVSLFICNRGKKTDEELQPLFAAVTSSIALTESAVSTVEDELKWSRKKSTVIVGFIMIILGTLSCLGYGPLSFVKIIGMQFLDFFDFLTNSVMMPIAALMTSLFVSKVVGVDRMEEEIRHGESKFRRKKIFVVMIKYLCPIFAIIILVSSVANAFGWISM